MGEWRMGDKLFHVRQPLKVERCKKERNGKWGSGTSDNCYEWKDAVRKRNGKWGSGKLRVGIREWGIGKAVCGRAANQRRVQ